jgi:GTP-binding protein YchF
MNFTLFGYPRTGKTTLFNLLTGAKIEVKAFEDGKKEPNVRSSPFPDERLDRLGAIHPDKKKIAAMIDFIDLAGISYGDIKNTGYLNYLRKADGLVHVVRAFENPGIPPHKGKVSPGEDIALMEEELILADLLSVEARLERLAKDLLKAKDPEAEKEKELLERLRPELEKGRAIREVMLSPQEEKLIRSFAFLSQKPILQMINIDEKQIPEREKLVQLFTPQKKGTGALIFCGKIEGEISELENSEKNAFLAEYGLKELCCGRLFEAAFALLEAISFFTIGKDEVRSWTIKQGTSALKAAGAIHSDIEKGFIRAEVIAVEELLRLGSLQVAKEKGAIRLEGKDYTVQDGDVIYFRFAS